MGYVPLLHRDAVKSVLLSALILTLLICGYENGADAQSVGASCTAAQATAANSACNVNGCYVCINNSGVYTWVQQPLYLGTAAAAVGSSCSTYPAGAVRYNTTIGSVEFCNGTTWQQLIVTQSGNNVTPPSGSGFFVMSSGTYNGNFGGYSASGNQTGLTGADAICLYELTHNTGWAFYTLANSRNQLVSGKVHAFLCEYGGCNSLVASTTYYFANAANSNAGGGSFTTDSNGIGPNDSANWSAANYFYGPYTYWSARNETSSTAWTNSSFNALQCNYTWSSSSSSDSNVVGIPNATGYSRWDGEYQGCNTPQHLVCYVNP